MSPAGVLPGQPASFTSCPASLQWCETCGCLQGHHLRRCVLRQLHHELPWRQMAAWLPMAARCHQPPCWPLAPACGASSRWPGPVSRGAASRPVPPPPRHTARQCPATPPLGAAVLRASCASLVRVCRRHQRALPTPRQRSLPCLAVEHRCSVSPLSARLCRSTVSPFPSVADCCSCSRLLPSHLECIPPAASSWAALVVGQPQWALRLWSVQL